MRPDRKDAAQAIPLEEVYVARSEDLREAYSALSTERLLAMVTVQASEYETGAVEVALEELRRRGVDPAQTVGAASRVQALFPPRFAFECFCNLQVKGCLVVLPGALFFVETPVDHDPVRTGCLALMFGGLFLVGHYAKKSQNDPSEKMLRLGIDIRTPPDQLLRALDTYVHSSEPFRLPSTEPIQHLFRVAFKAPELQSLKLGGSILIATDANGEFRFTLRSALELDFLVDALFAGGFPLQV
jgi:hypothetical protein